MSEGTKMFKPQDVIQQRFQILSVLGRGSQGIVYRVLDLKTKKVMVLKQHMNTNYRLKEDIEQINRESQILKQLNHPNIMKCYQQINFPDQILQVFEYIDGDTLSQFIQNQFPYEQNLEEFVDIKKLFQDLEPLKNKPDFIYTYQSMVKKVLKPKLQQKNCLNDEMIGYQIKQVQNEVIDYEELNLAESQIQVSKANLGQSVMFAAQNSQIITKPKYIEAVEHIFKQLVDTLVYLEDKETMHRDLKPDNIMISKSMQLKIIDFGFVKKSSTTQTFVGSTGYMAPEIYISEQRDKGFNHKVDVWSAGVILYQMLFGYCPILVTKNFMFMGLQAQKGLFLPTDLFENTDQKLTKVIERALAADPAQRPSARQLLQLFNQHADTVKENKVAMKELLVTCIGDYQTGKTSILSKMAKSSLTQNVSQLQRQITIQNEQINIIFNDTVGTEARQGSLLPQIFRGSNIVFFVFSRQKAESFKNLQFYERIISNQAPNSLRKTIAVDFGGAVECPDKADFEVKRSALEVEDILMKCIQESLESENYEIKEGVLKIQEGKGAEKGKKKCC